MDASDLPIRELDRTAVQETVRLLSLAGPGDLARPTPCDGWTLGSLVAHMTAQNRGFAAAARGEGADPAVWRPHRGDDSPAGHRAAAAEVLAAFAGDGIGEREFALPEFDPVRRFPGRVAIGFHFLDQTVHAWDVARTLGVGFTPSEAAAEAALRIALRVPDDERRFAEGAFFGPALPAAPGATPFERALAALGRVPGWTPALAVSARGTGGTGGTGGDGER
ncbi:TIGR03086 family metal-binding protein [Streptomyces zhihengii]|uniref:TIGR03086 family protein n=1 Tax=Streptomyces zhihengii TaxID=1818004 RepID=A0ABS2UKE5_9ACTN|nr:TIGR03086 family metal-binding protein [Streptomyces zhihengii]MBM9618010.1 TIGR03086 family protein [Streptomyces zhihengii]